MPSFFFLTATPKIILQLSQHLPHLVLLFRMALPLACEQNPDTIDAH